MLAPAAQAFTILGFTLFGEEEDNSQVDIIDPHPYQATFSVSNDTEGLESVLQGASSLWTGRETAASGSAGLISTAQDDYRTLIATLYQRGFYAAAISIRINGVEASTIPLTRSLAKPAQVAISVDPGPLFRFGDLGTVNRAPPRDLPPGEGGRTARDSFYRGARARADVIAAVGDQEVENWRYAGHPKARVDDRQVVADHRDNTLDVTIRMDPGPVARFGKVTVNTDTGGVKPGFVRYMADIPEGGRFDPEVIQRGIDRLNNLRVFRAVRFKEADSINPDGTLPITIETAPRKPRRFGLGASLSTTEGVALEGFWLHRQIGQRAERLRFDVSISGIGQEGNAADYDYVVSTTFTKPGFLDPDNSLLAGVTLRHEVFDTYSENAAEVELGLERRFNDRLSGSVFTEAIYSEVEDGDGITRYQTFSLPISATYEARDVPLDATSGFYLKGEVEPLYELEFDTQAVRLVAEARTYWEVIDNRTVLAFRGKMGTIFGGNLNELPPDETFFTGGGGSVRGYDYRSNGIEVDGETVGGRSMLELSAEVRQYLTDSLGLVLFADAGLVSADTFPGDGDFRVGAGAGLRYDTGLGPLRLDVAVPIDPREGDPSFALYIGIGQAF